MGITIRSPYISVLLQIMYRKGWFSPKGLLLPQALWKIINFCLPSFFFPSLGQTQSAFFSTFPLCQGFFVQSHFLFLLGIKLYMKRESVHDINMYVQISPKIDEVACLTFCHSINLKLMSLMLPFIDQFREGRTHG